ncbi:hypothetical protein NDU88_000280 [Pleurodeles waltl]|uniref:Uncharacterized protein n=1 Tax=Pleurodeles waltl TaxID=8319 RepID=A0AAV7TF72_PLEWA|nr:hypothetical protein NDU88_000280 [Pleurodeles waltl]
MSGEPGERGADRHAAEAPITDREPPLRAHPPVQTHCMSALVVLFVPPATPPGAVLGRAGRRIPRFASAPQASPAVSGSALPSDEGYLWVRLLGSLGQHPVSVGRVRLCILMTPSMTALRDRACHAPSFFLSFGASPWGPILGVPKFRLPLLSAAVPRLCQCRSLQWPTPDRSPSAHLIPGIGPPARMDHPEPRLVLGAWQRPSLKFSGPRWWSSLFLRLLHQEQSSVMRDGASLASFRHRRRHPLCRDRLFPQARAICG